MKNRKELDRIVEIVALFEAGVTREALAPRFKTSQAGIVKAIHAAYHGPDTLEIRAELDRRKAAQEQAESQQWTWGGNK